MFFKRSITIFFIVFFSGNLVAESKPVDEQAKNSSTPDIFEMLEETLNSDSTD